MPETRKQQSELIKLLIAIVMVFVDILAMMVFGIIMIFFYHLVLGLNKKNLLIYGPSIATEVAVHQVFFFPCMTGYPKIKEWCSRQNRYVVFSAYFSVLLATAFISIFIQCIIIDFVWYTRDNFTKPAYQAFTGVHQIITFILTTSHSILANYHFFKDLDPFAGGVCAEIITWFVWGIWIGACVSPVSNINQISSYTQWIPIINLMNHGIFKGANMNVFKNDMSKFGLMFAGIQVPIIICYIISFLFDRYVILPGILDEHRTGHHIWSFAALAWLPFQITGTRIAPLYYDKFCKTADGHNRWFRMFIWVLIFIAICIPILAAFYMYFQELLYNIIIVKVLKCTDYKGDPPKTNLESWPLRPAYFFGFGIGILYAVWFDTLHISRDGLSHQPSQQQSQKLSDVEGGLEITQGQVGSQIQSIH